MKVGIACLGFLVGLTGTAHARPWPLRPCLDARYDISGGGHATSHFGTIPNNVTVDGDAIQFDTWCRLEGVKRRTTGVGSTKIRARFEECGPLGRGRIRLVVGETCAWANMVVKVKNVRRKLRMQATRYDPPSTFHTIEDRIFSERGCAVSTCHGADAAGGLDLRPGIAFASLVGVTPDNAAARAKGLQRVKPGDVVGSFLSAKLRGTLAADEGDPMPSGDDPVPAVAVDLIDAWIAAGAPQSGHVEGAPELPPRIYTETPPLAPPANGFQMVLEGPVLQPKQEQEGCLWVPAPPADVAVQRIEYALNPGTHHFAIWRHSGDAPPPLDTWLPNDIACLNSGGSLGQNLSGAPHAPYFVAEQPPGFAVLLPGATYYGLNAHYYNESSQPIQMKVWVNFHLYEGTPDHLVHFLPFDLSASGGINVPPYTERTTRGRFTNTSGQTMHVMGVGGHMHKRGVRFSVWTSDGTKVHDDFDWAHPSSRPFVPPHALAPGDWFDFECLHDNGVNRPVRSSGGYPLTLVFGVSAEDEMCILTGTYY
jgi:hypothetical protein